VLIRVFTPGAAVAGVDSFARWIDVGRHVTWFSNRVNGSLLGILSRAGLGWPVWLPLAALAGLLTLAALRRGNALDSDWLRCGTLALLVSPLGWVYYVPLLAGPLAALMIKRPVLLWTCVGLLSPVLQVVARAPLAPWSAVTLFSLPFWSLLALWCSLLAGRLAASARAPHKAMPVGSTNGFTGLGTAPSR
jgi:hypothetical protein